MTKKRISPKQLVSMILTASIIFTCAGALIPVNAYHSDYGENVARAIMDEGIVLMKNEENALPLQKGERIALFGEAQILRLYNSSEFNSSESMTIDTLSVQHGYIPYGAGSSQALGDGGVKAAIDPLGALQEAEKEGRVSIYAKMSDAYAEPLKKSRSDKEYKAYEPTDEEVSEAASNADTAIVFIRRWDGECVDLSKKDWNLTKSEEKLLKQVSASFKKVVVVLNTPAPIATGWSKDEIDGIHVDAVLFAGYGGMQGGLVIADVLLGDVNPSGKLVDTYAKELTDYPTTAAFSAVNQKYTEDIFLGYRYFETFDKEYEKVNYEFGFGLSYTTFEIKNEAFSFENGTVTVAVSVKNTGSVAGKETVQLYVSAPQGVLGKAAKSLCAFQKTGLLEPGASEKITLTVPIAELASFDDLGKTGNKSAYVLESGDYVFLVGNSVRNVTEAGRATVEKTTVTRQLTALCQTNLDKRLLADGSMEELPAPTVVETGEDAHLLINYPAIVECEDFYSSGGPKTDTFTGYLYIDDSWEGGYEQSCLAHTYLGTRSACYKLEVGESGEYLVSVRMANHVQYDNEATCYLYISQTEDVFPDNPDATMTVEHTSSESGSDYYGFMDAPADKTVHLEKGVNYLKITLDGAPNVDFLAFAPESFGEAALLEALIDLDEDPDSGVKEPAPKDTYYQLSDVVTGKVTMQEFLAQMTTSELAAFFVSYTGNKAGADNNVCNKYGIRRYSMADGPHGFNSNGTSFPCENVLACTWNPDLATALGLIVGAEGYEIGIGMWLAPAMNLHRNPIAGRNSEYYSEDPLISGTFAVAEIQAAQSMGLSACAKHFVCNEKEDGKLSSDSRVSERALRELYLKPFEMAVTVGHVTGVMSSYNLVNGVAASENAELLRGILRDEWGFEGVVTGDWNNNKDAVKELNAGNNIREPYTYCDISVLKKAIADEQITRETLEEGASRVLYAIMRAKSYYQEHPCEGEHRYENGVCAVCHNPDPYNLATLRIRLIDLLDLSEEGLPAPEPTAAPATDEPAVNTPEPETEVVKPKSPVIPFVIAGAVLVAAGAAAGIAIAVKKKKKQ
jgi:beta-glucosidase-like glycosyl hydrolase